MTIKPHHFGRGLIGRVRRVEIALLHRIAITVVAILLELLLALAVCRVGDYLIRIGGLLRLRRVNRLDALRRLRHHVFLSALFIRVIGPGCEEEQRAAQPDLLRIVRQITHTHSTRRLHHHITRALRAIPVTTGVEIVVTTVRNP